MSAHLESGVPGVSIYYDGQCPMCAAYTRMVRLREAAGCVRLVDVRGDRAQVAEFLRQGMDINAGFVVQVNGRYFHGADAIHVLALLSSPRSVAAWVNRLLFRQAWLARLLYPLLVRGRAVLLFLLGKRLIDHGLR